MFPGAGVQSPSLEESASILPAQLNHTENDKTILPSSLVPEDHGLDTGHQENLNTSQPLSRPETGKSLQLNATQPDSNANKVLQDNDNNSQTNDTDAVRGLHSPQIPLSTFNESSVDNRGLIGPADMNTSVPEDTQRPMVPQLNTTAPINNSGLEGVSLPNNTNTVQLLGDNRGLQGTSQPNNMSVVQVPSDNTVLQSNTMQVSGDNRGLLQVNNNSQIIESGRGLPLSNNISSQSGAIPLSNDSTLVPIDERGIPIVSQSNNVTLTTASPVDNRGLDVSFQEDHEYFHCHE